MLRNSGRCFSTSVTSSDQSRVPSVEKRSSSNGPYSSRNSPAVSFVIKRGVVPGSNDKPASSSAGNGVSKSGNACGISSADCCQYFLKNPAASRPSGNTQLEGKSNMLTSVFRCRLTSACQDQVSDVLPGQYRFLVSARPVAFYQPRVSRVFQ